MRMLFGTRFVVLLLISGAVLLLGGCDTVEGPEGPEGPPGSVDVTVINLVLDGDAFTRDDNNDTFTLLFREFTIPELTPAIANQGVVNAYLRLDGSDFWNPLPISNPIRYYDYIFAPEIFDVAVLFDEVLSDDEEEFERSLIDNADLRIVLIPSETASTFNLTQSTVQTLSLSELDEHLDGALQGADGL